jgi:pantoate--beta-alanine ligase
MELIEKVAEMQRRVKTWREAGETVALVPTMGAFHDGHLSLMEQAKAHADRVVVSLFINPAQFGPQEDFDKYPRDFDRDRGLAEEMSIDVLFCPEIRDMYPLGFQTSVSVPILAKKLEGASRPGHFRGVCTVVLKLFNLCQPHVALFGWKDAQQFIILCHMVRDLNLQIRMVGIPTVREKDGLAMSSRNRRLTPEQREQAVCLSRALRRVHYLVKDQGIVHTGELLQAMRSIIRSADQAELDYAAIVSRSTLDPLDIVEKGNTLVALAVRFGEVRLIDNTRL